MINNTKDVKDAAIKNLFSLAKKEVQELLWNIPSQLGKCIMPGEVRHTWLCPVFAFNHIQIT